MHVSWFHPSFFDNFAKKNVLNKSLSVGRLHVRKICFYKKVEQKNIVLLFCKLNWYICVQII